MRKSGQMVLTMMMTRKKITESNSFDVAAVSVAVYVLL